MKHHCHCGFKKHHDLSKGKRLGALGVTFMILHLLYHVAECLILPAVFMAFSNHHDDTAVAVSETISEQINLDETTTSDESLIRTGLKSQPYLYTNFFETLY
jgi:cell division protein FtsX